MAAIDKLYLHSYEELVEFRNWLIIYYPKALRYLYNNWMMDYDSYNKHLVYWITESMKISKNESLRKLGGCKSIDGAIINIQEYYKKNGYECPFSQAYDEASEIIKRESMSYDDWEENYSFPIMNAPFKVDKRLKWICPLPSVRKYLHNQCGVNPKWEWLYKIFWRGKEFI